MAEPSKKYKDAYCADLNSEFGLDGKKQSWYRVDVPRKSSEKKASDPYWFHPDGWRFRSRKEVDRWRDSGFSVTALENTAFVGNKDAFDGLGISKGEAQSQGKLTADQIQKIGKPGAAAPAAKPAAAAKPAPKAASAVAKPAPKAAPAAAAAGKKRKAEEVEEEDEEEEEEEEEESGGKAAKAIGKTGRPRVPAVAVTQASSKTAKEKASAAPPKKSTQADERFLKMQESFRDTIQFTGKVKAEGIEPVNNAPVLSCYQKKLWVGDLRVTHMLGSDLRKGNLMPSELHVYQRTVYDAVSEFAVKPYLSCVGASAFTTEEPFQGSMVLCRCETVAVEPAAVAGQVDQLTHFFQVLNARARVGFCQTLDNNAQAYLIPGQPIEPNSKPPVGLSDEELKNHPSTLRKYLTDMIDQARAKGSFPPPGTEDAFVLLLVRKKDGRTLLDSPGIGELPGYQYDETLGIPPPRRSEPIAPAPTFAKYAADHPERIAAK